MRCLLQATVRDSSTSLGMIITRRSLRLFYHVTEIFGGGVATELTFKNWRRVHGYQLVALQNELRIDSIARRFINLVAAKVTVEFVFVVVIAAEFETLSVRGELLFFIQHHQFCRAPGLARPPDVAPELIIGFVIPPSDKIISSRFGCDVLSHLEPGLLNALWNGFAGAEKRRAEQEIACEQKASDASHSFRCTSFIAALRLVQTNEMLNNCAETAGPLPSRLLLLK